MGKPLKKRQKRLQKRTDEYDKLPLQDQRGRKRPGSMNLRSKR
jgi:hypothetical protein